MNIQLEIPDEELKQMFKDEVGNISKEEWHDIVLSGIKKAFDEQSDLKNLFMKRKMGNSYWNSESYYEAGPLLLEAAKSIDLTSECKEVSDMVIDTLRTDHREILIDVMLKLLVQGMFDNYGFNEKMTSTCNALIGQRLSEVSK